MEDKDKRFQKYYSKKKYKGFYKLREHNYKLMFRTHLTFSNGNRVIFASGSYKEEALKKAFDKIDSLHSCE